MTHTIDRIGKFDIIETLGAGSLGEVFLARDRIIGREVAIKLIRKSALPSADAEGWFQRESQAASRLSHPNVATIHEFGETDGLFFQVMDPVTGPDLGTLFAGHAVTPRESLDLLAQVCDGLAHAHLHGMAHRNLKPSNIRMGRVTGRPAPKILDFGLARSPGGDPASTPALLETLAHSAPEALQGRGDARSDLFSVGTLLYEALTGTRPFQGDTPAAVAQRVREEQPAPLDLLLYPELSPAIQGILRQALAKDPAQRFASATAMAAALRAARDPAWTPQAEPAEPLESTRLIPRPLPAAGANARSSRPLVWACALVLLAAVGGGGFWLRARARARRPAPPAQAQPPAPPSPPAAPAPAQAAAPAAAPTAAAAPAPAAASTPAAAPAPAAASTPAAAPAPAARPPYATMDAAAEALDKDPEGVLAFADREVAADPGNERAHALRIVALYNLARYAASAKAIREAREAGHPLWPMALKNPPLKKMLEQDVKSHHLIKRKAPEAPQPAPDPAA